MLYPCAKCKTAKPAEEMTCRKDRTPTYCKACTNLMAKASYLRNKETYQRRGPRRRFEARDLLIRLKSEPCTDCKEKFHFSQMDFDHRPGEKKRRPVSQMSLMGLDSIMAEVAKCDLVCANCHRDRTQARLPEPELMNGDSYFQKYRRKMSEDITAFVNGLKDQKDCVDCGKPHPYWRLDFDHLEGSGKANTVARMKLARYSRESILEEAAKCELVCVNHHRLRTWNRMRARKAGQS